MSLFFSELRKLLGNAKLIVAIVRQQSDRYDLNFFTPRSHFVEHDKKIVNYDKQIF